MDLVQTVFETSTPKYRWNYRWNFVYRR